MSRLSTHPFSWSTYRIWESFEFITKILFFSLSPRRLENFSIFALKLSFLFRILQISCFLHIFGIFSILIIMLLNLTDKRLCWPFNRLKKWKNPLKILSIFDVGGIVANGTFHFCRNFFFHRELWFFYSSCFFWGLELRWLELGVPLGFGGGFFFFLCLIFMKICELRVNHKVGLLPLFEHFVRTDDFDGRAFVYLID